MKIIKKIMRWMWLIIPIIITASSVRWMYLFMKANVNVGDMQSAALGLLLATCIIFMVSLYLVAYIGDWVINFYRCRA